jgi:L-aspartate oxidase
MPIEPAQHYSMGGIKTDEWGRTRVKGFYAVGEAACTGIHGANRLASNSLLEGLVFGKRIGLQIAENFAEIKKHEGLKPAIKENKQRIRKDVDALGMIQKLQEIMNQDVGIARNKEGLSTALASISEMQEQLKGVEISGMLITEIKNMLTLSNMVVKAALLREESRGAHYRSDFPNLDDKNWLKNIVFRGGNENAGYVIGR